MLPSWRWLCPGRGGWGPPAAGPGPGGRWSHSPAYSEWSITHPVRAVKLPKAVTGGSRWSVGSVVILSYSCNTTL